MAGFVAEGPDVGLRVGRRDLHVPQHHQPLPIPSHVIQPAHQQPTSPHRRLPMNMRQRFLNDEEEFLPQGAHVHRDKAPLPLLQLTLELFLLLKRKNAVSMGFERAKALG